MDERARARVVDEQARGPGPGPGGVEAYQETCRPGPSLGHCGFGRQATLTDLAVQCPVLLDLADYRAAAQVFNVLSSSQSLVGPLHQALVATARPGPKAVARAQRRVRPMSRLT